MAAENKLVLDTELSTKQFDKDVQQLEKKSNEVEKKNKPKIDFKLSIESFKNKLKEIKNEIKNELKNFQPEITPEVKPLKKEDIKNMWADYEPPEFVDTIEFDAQIEYLEQKIEYLRNMLQKPMDFNITHEDLPRLYAEEEKLTAQLIKLKEKQQEFNGEIDKGKKNAENLSKSMGGILKKVAKWSLAIFSVRSAYSLITRATSSVSKYNEGIANDIEYINYALTSVLEPIIRAIVNLVAKCLQYVNYLWNAWTGDNLFKSAKDFENMKKSSEEVAQSTKEIKKNMAGFDEMNVLEDNSSTASASSGGGGGTTFDLTDMSNFTPPKGLEIIKDIGTWIIDHWKLVAIGIGGIALAFGAFKLGKWFSNMKKVPKTLTKVGTSFTGFLDGLGKAIEAIAILGGLALVINSITGLIKAFAESGLEVNDVLGLMAGVILPLIALIGTLTLATQLLQNPMAMGGLVLLTGSLVAILFTLKATLPTILDACAKFINKTGPFIIELINTINDGITDIIEALGTVLPPIIETVGDLFTKVFDGISKTIETVGDTIVRIMETADGLINSVLDSIIRFISKLGPAINNFVDEAIKAATKLINFLVSGIEYLINTLVVDGINSLLKGLNGLIPGEKFDIGLIDHVDIARFQPKLAKGGILSQPGRGVPVGGAIAGEAGREGYLPLTDSQVMAQLGETIGKYINLNLTNIVKLDNRQIAREQKIINAQNDFVFNR